MPGRAFGALTWTIYDNVELLSTELLRLSLAPGGLLEVGWGRVMLVGGLPGLSAGFRMEAYVGPLLLIVVLFVLLLVNE